MQSLLIPLMPKDRRLIIDLAKDAGLDVSDWSNFAGGASKAASNPKYCYEWSFMQRDVIVLNLWFENLVVKDGRIIQRLNLRNKARKEQKAVWKRRAWRVDHAIRTAYFLELPFKAIICSGQLRRKNTATAKASQVQKRMLDNKTWAVASYNTATGECILERDLAPVIPVGEFELDVDEHNGFEGKLRERFVFYRSRERRLRRLKIEQAIDKNNGKLICEVPGCGFDFARIYGRLGEEYAEVHHKFPLKSAPMNGRATTLEDLVIVCSNCHAMIHRHGKCRPIESLINRRRKIDTNDN